MRHGIVVVLAVALLVGITAEVKAIPAYQVTTLGTLGGPESAAYAINDVGQVAGWASIPGWTRKACVWSNKVPEDIGLSSGEIFGINDSGKATGGSLGQAFVWSKTGGITFITDSSSGVGEGRAINRDGEVAGVVHGSQYGGAFFWDEVNGFRKIDTVNGKAVNDVYDINDHGQVVGYSGNAGAERAVVWDKNSGTKVLSLLPGGRSAAAYGINNFGDVVGFSQTDTPYTSLHSCLWDEFGVAHDLGVLPGFLDSYAQAVNDHGVVVGYCTNNNGAEYDRAFLWTKATGMVALDTLAPRGTLGGLERIGGINESGQIVGYSAHAYGRALLLTPVPEPSSLIVLLAGLGSFGSIICRRSCRCR